MAIYSQHDANFIKLKGLRKEQLRNLCELHGIEFDGSITAGIKKILNRVTSGSISTSDINDYIKELYSTIREDEISASGATHEAIVAELNRVDSHIWGMVQGAVDGHIQANYVRRFFRYQEILDAVRASLYDTITSYTLCTWFNHWSTVFLEDLICRNPRVIPIIKKVKGVDIIWNEQPLDIKVTNLPREWFDDGRTIDDAISNPPEASEYLYRLQGQQRFGDENRLFIIIYDRHHPADSWKIKRNYTLIKDSVAAFFSQASELDPIHFEYNGHQYLAHSKALFIVE